RQLAEAAYATSANTNRVEVAGEFRRPLLPTILYIELRASGLELLRFYGVGNETDGSQPDSVYRVGQKQLLVGPRVAIPLAPRLRVMLGPLLKYAHSPGDAGTVLTTTGPYYGAGDFGEVGARAGLELDTRDHTVAPASGRAATSGSSGLRTQGGSGSRGGRQIAGTRRRGAGSGSPGSTAGTTHCRWPWPRAPSARPSTSASGSCFRVVAVCNASAAGLPSPLRYPGQPGRLFTKETPSPPGVPSKRRSSPCLPALGA